MGGSDAHQRDHVARLRLQRDQRALQRLRAALAPHRLLDPRQAVGQHLLGQALQAQVQRGVDGEVLRVQVLRVVALAQLRAHQVHEVRRVEAGHRGGPVDPQRLRHGLGGPGLVHEPGLLHRLQHLVAPLDRALGVAVGVVGVGRLDHAGQERALRQRQVADVLVEVHPRGLAEAVDAERAGLAQVDLVQVQLQDVLLLRAPLQHEREQGLLRLALHGALRRQEEVLAELLGDGAAAVRDLALAAHVADDGAHQPDGVEPGVAEEAAVLDGQHRLHHVPRQLVVLDAAALLACLVEEVGDELRLQRNLGLHLLRADALHLLDAFLLDRHRHRLVRRAVHGARVQREHRAVHAELAGAQRARGLLLVLEPVQDLGQAVHAGRQAGTQDHRLRIEAGRRAPPLALQAAVHHRAEAQVIEDERGRSEHHGQRHQRQQDQHQLEALGRVGVRAGPGRREATDGGSHGGSIIVPGLPGPGMAA
jgi:hypothetical protein